MTMASGYFEGAGGSSIPHLYCVWDSVADNEKNTSDVALSVYYQYNSTTAMVSGTVTVKVLDFDKPHTVKTPAFSDNLGENFGVKSHFLTRWEWKGIPHEIDGTKKVKLSAVWCAGGNERSAEEEVVLDSIPQDPPVLESRRVMTVTQSSATLSMQASHPLGIREYVFTVNGVEQKRTEGETTFSDLQPNTQYVATFQAIAQNGLSTRTATEIFTTEPIYVDQFTVKYVRSKTLEENKDNEINLLEGETGELKVDFTSPEDASIQDLLYTSSNPKVATVSRDGIVRAVSKGTCRIDIRAADGGPAEASVIINVVQDVKCVYIINPLLRLPLNGTGNIICSVYPETANNKSLSFESSKESVATVTDQGVVTGVGVGEATIIVRTNNAFENTQYVCKVQVEQEEDLAWNEMFPLPQGCRWDYRIPAAIYTNLCYIWNRLKPPTGNEEEESLEEIVFLPGYATHIREVQEQINALERNIDKINDAIDWINPYYVEHREFLEKTPVQKDINRWILFCADMKAVLDGEKDKLWPLSLAGQPLAIRQNDALQYLCIREEK